MRDPRSEHPIAGAWRDTLRAVAQAFAEGDYQLKRGVPSVEPPDEQEAGRIGEYIARYGATLTALPDTTWETSVASWQGSYWDLLIDLWTVEEGRSDLALHCQVHESEGRFHIAGIRVYVP